MGKLGWPHEVCRNKLSVWFVEGRNDPDLEAEWPLVKEESELQGVLLNSKHCSSKLARPKAFGKDTSLGDLYNTSLGGLTKFPSYLSVVVRLS